MKCPKCNNIASVNDKFCQYCGEQLNTDKLEINDTSLNRCKTCNAEVSSEDIYCLECGSKLKEEDAYSNLNINNYEQKYNSKEKSGTSITISSIVLGLSFFVASISPILFIIASIGAIGFAVYIFIKEKTRKAGWSIALASLALLFSISGLVDGLTQKKYAYESADRISEVIGFELPDVEPDYFKISIMDEQITSVTLTGYSFNDLVYVLSDEEASLLESRIELNNTLFSDEYLDDLNSEFITVILPNTDVSLVFDLEKDAYTLPTDLKEYRLIVVNYNYESKTLQVLEVYKVGM